MAQGMPVSGSAPAQRLLGLDLARGLAVAAMIFVNFLYVLSYQYVQEVVADPASLGDHTPLGATVFVLVLGGLAGRAASVFLVLFGIGLALQWRKLPGPTSSSDAPGVPVRKRTEGLRALMRRYLWLVGGGLAFQLLWEADILHFIGFFGLLCLPLAGRSWKIQGSALLMVLAVAEGLLLRFDYSFGWQPGAIGASYEDLWTPLGQLRQLIFNGYHPVFPWIAFVLLGLMLGRLDLRDGSVLKRLVAVGLAGAVVGHTAQGLGVPAGFFPADTLFILLGMAHAMWVIAACLLLCRDGRPLAGVRDMGRLALSHYVGHVLVGILPLFLLDDELGRLSFEASCLAAVAYLVITVPMGRLWLCLFSRGPFESALRSLAKGGLNGDPARFPMKPGAARSSKG